MKNVGLILAWMVVATVVTAAEPLLEGYGMRFKPATTNIQWAITNELRPSLWTYRRTGEAFSGAMISNIVAVCGFSWGERTNAAVRPRDKKLFYFKRGDGERHYLGIHGPLGRVEFLDENAHTVDLDSSGVPDDQEARAKALAILEKIGIFQSELARDSLTGRVLVTRLFSEVSGRNKRTGEMDQRVNSRSVYVLRSLDGVNFSGYGTDGGAEITFGNEGKLHEVKILWLPLTRLKEEKVAPPDEILRRIRDGKGFMSPGPLSDVIYWQPGLQKLIINRVRLFYHGRQDEDENPPEIVYPFAALDVTARYANTNLNTVLNVPVLK